MYVRIHTNIFLVKLQSGGKVRSEKYEDDWKTKIDFTVSKGWGGVTEGDRGIKGESVEGKEGLPGKKARCGSCPCGRRGQQ